MSPTFRPKPSRGRRPSRESRQEWQQGEPRHLRVLYALFKSPFRWRVTGLLLVVFSVFLFVVDTRIRPSIEAIATSVATRTATEAVNDALQSVVAESPYEGKILHVETDASGNIRLATFDFHSVSIVQAAATHQSEETLSKLSSETFSLPVSQTFGGPLLSVFTPEIPVRMRMIGSAHSSIRLDVKSLGINQSVHALYLDVTAQVQAVAPLVTKPVEIHTSVPLAYVVLSGEIPNTYLGRATVDLPVLPPLSGQK